MSIPMSDECHPRTLYVGNLDSTVSEDLLCTLFSQIGPVKGCKIIREAGNDPYAFVEFTNHQSASTALGAMNKRSFLGKEMKVNWASSPGNQPKQDTSNHYHIFVGDLSPEIDTQTLKEAFSPFGEISNCRIVRDPQTLKSKGYAFVSFVKKSEAENAIASMSGQWLGSRSIRTNWSTRKPPPHRNKRARTSNIKNPTYEEVYSLSSPSNCTVYCGAFIYGITEELMQSVFSPFGTIQDIRVFKDKGYAFIKFTTKDSATRAIEAIHNTEINGQLVKCFWGKETGDPNVSQNINSSTATTQYSYGYGQPMGYWYQNPTPAPQFPTQYPVQGYPPYGQVGGYPPGVSPSPQYVGTLPWQGMPATHTGGTGNPASTTNTDSVVQGPIMQHPPATMMTYAMQQFPTQ